MKVERACLADCTSSGTVNTSRSETICFSPQFVADMAYKALSSVLICYLHLISPIGDAAQIVGIPSDPQPIAGCFENTEVLWGGIMFQNALR